MGVDRGRFVVLSVTPHHPLRHCPPRYNHIDMEDLEAKLIASQHCQTRLIATDGVFSMDGDVAPCDEILDLAEKYDATLFVDECHATGFFGATGRGTMEHCGVQVRAGACG